MKMFNILLPVHRRKDCWS